jgi:hypothetical protein
LPLKLTLQQGATLHLGPDCDIRIEKVRIEARRVELVVSAPPSLRISWSDPKSHNFARRSGRPISKEAT